MAPSTSPAQEWHDYKSTSTLFELRIPDNVQEEKQEFRIGPKRLAQIGQAFSTVDQRPFKDAVKNYIIKYVQTLGLEIKNDDVPDFITYELDQYVNHYAKLGGVLETRNDLIFQHRTPGGEIQISFNDPQLGPQTIRARVFFTDTGKIQQIVSGPAEVMDSISTRNYLESIILREGYRQDLKSFKEDWPKIISPLGIFTAYLPKKMEPYVPQDIQISNSEDTERISTRFYDPIYKETLFYNVYGYQLGQELNDLHVENLLRKKHVLRHVFRDGAIQFDKLTSGGVAILQTEYEIDPPKKFPYVTQVKLRAEFANDRILVHEIMGSPELVSSNFIGYVTDSVEFHQ
jgi:hypothetical protein